MNQLSEEQQERELPPLSPEEAIQQLTRVLQLLESIEGHKSPLPKARVLLRGIIGCGIAAPLLDSDSQLKPEKQQQRSIPKMDHASRLALEANNDTVTLRKGQTVHIDGLPYELLEDVPAYSATVKSSSQQCCKGNQESNK